MGHMARLLTALFVSLMAFSTNAASADGVDEILARETPPPGVVFDVDEWDHDALEWAVPQIRDYVDRLRARFPELPIAVVSHGEEEFALMKNAQKQYQAVQHEVEELVNDQVEVHVCAGHAIMSGVSEQGFVEFVEPVPAGVQTIAEYRNRGFVYIVVDKP
jgi:intracellular sulfur oxidation DsrE/DsrF family protein